MAEDRQTLSKEHRARLYQEIIKLQTGSGTEVTGAPKRINNILSLYGQSLSDLADHPEWLLGQSGQDKRVQKLEQQLRQAVAKTNAILRENERLRNQVSTIHRTKSKLNKTRNRVTNAFSTFFTNVANTTGRSTGTRFMNAADTLIGAFFNDDKRETLSKSFRYSSFVLSPLMFIPAYIVDPDKSDWTYDPEPYIIMAMLSSMTSVFCLNAAIVSENSLDEWATKQFRLKPKIEAALNTPLCIREKETICDPVLITKTPYFSSWLPLLGNGEIEESILHRRFMRVTEKLITNADGTPPRKQVCVASKSVILPPNKDPLWGYVKEHRDCEIVPAVQDASMEGEAGTFNKEGIMNYGLV
ncbi:MAG: hypothetical protein R3D66_01895 [Alphaproteobacteria bacterium]